ncbi:Two-component response regulator, PleD family, consists of two REC domains and a diguanylate cyclase (GGDEF) domain [Maridesulfovibrio ferrireducens]|uniref:Two-component response regulator, PleD family, consists of two REC domains and a diguanylate cyclase (GGDEF) domain n=1 Tax=Maridesulfovibrio ferrireducens TaxID=246191 RepID=A0A1G9CU13_9BACT|nr:response regulator [Maridesulfovibrio ferrireducens]SDK55148.1 Two-component response regulator, PleD family, consists of two REC domains and a diguanylate cyclase (GGDEF) domain [Maridesulfovibrio ferrireducens]
MSESAKNTVLVVESSHTQVRIITEHIESLTPFDTITASSLDQVEEMLENNGEDIFIAVLNLNIKGAPDGEAVDYVLSRKIPCIVLTSTFDEKIRNRFIEKNVLDYFNKGNRTDLDEMVDLISRIHSNRDIKVVVAEDNGTARKIMCKLLERLNFNVFAAEDGAKALDIIRANPDVKLLLTDYEMPELDGFELVTEVRKTHYRDQLAILGVSAHDSGAITAKFLKRGANDFLKKPFEVEEFSWRVTNNINELERISSIKDAYSRDPLTGFGNLNTFIEQGREIFENYSNQERTPVLAAFNVDNMLEINSRFGWDAGAAALKKAAANLEQQSLGWLLSARWDGGFIVLAEDSEILKNDLVAAQAGFAKTAIGSVGERFKGTASFAVCKKGEKDLDITMSKVVAVLEKMQSIGVDSYRFV